MELLEGYVALAVLAIVIACCVAPAVQLVIGGVSHPLYRPRRARAWIALAVIPLMLWGPFDFPRIALSLTMALLVLGWPVYRDLPSSGPLIRIGVLLAVLALFIMVSLSTRAWWRQTHCPSLERLVSADPTADAKAAMVRGDDHLLMVGGFVGIVSGGERSSLPETLIEGTGDDVTMACSALRPIAEKYARQYNLTVVAAAESPIPAK